MLSGTEAPWIITALLGALTIVVSWRAVVASRKRGDQDGWASLVESAAALHAPLRKELDEVRAEVAGIKEDYEALKESTDLEIEALHQWARELTAQLVRYGHEPIRFEEVLYRMKGRKTTDGPHNTADS